MVAFELRHLLDTADTHSVARLGKLVNRRFQTARQHALEQPVLGRTSPRQAVDEAAPLPSKSHVLKAHSKAGYIAGSDIVRMYQLKPTKYAAKPVIRDIIKGRYVQTLQPTGAHYVFFDSFADAAVFWSDVRSALFNGSYVSFTFVNFEDEMGQMFFPVLADTRIRKELPPSVETAGSPQTTAVAGHTAGPQPARVSATAPCRAVPVCRFAQHPEKHQPAPAAGLLLRAQSVPDPRAQSAPGVHGQNNRAEHVRGDFRDRGGRAAVCADGRRRTPVLRSGTAARARGAARRESW
ncbi:hypothetical protein KL939_004742 [Ogataea angusta]|nr:hypothetical protein KL943_005356 [Ogataea angusta]KAG7854993.1 hypothetical protein KL939_004742 [Ogataea angusta]